MKSRSKPVLIIIPTHSHPWSLPFSIESALEQTYSNVEIVVIGDGVDDQTRNIAQKYSQKHLNVNFLDFPKAIRHGEEYRDEVISASQADFITYLGDDDLFLPNHVELMMEAISDVDFINPLPMFVNPDKTLTYLATDLADKSSLEWHLDEHFPRNSVSLTGVMHTRESYFRLEKRWQPAPMGRWTDHYMWSKYFRLEGFTAKTLPYATTIKFPNTARESVEIDIRQAEIKYWWTRMHKPKFWEDWTRSVFEAVLRVATQQNVELTQKLSEVELLHSELDASQSKLAQVLGSKSWKITVPLRQLKSFVNK